MPAAASSPETVPDTGNDHEDAIAAINAGSPLISAASPDSTASGTGWSTAGSEYSQPVLIDERTVLAALEALVPLAPLHQPHHIAAIRAVSRRGAQGAADGLLRYRLSPVSQPVLAQEFALPRELTAKGIRRYGFHGLSYEYIVSVLPQVAPNCAGGKLVVAHLGNGASMCAIDQGPQHQRPPWA
jgi:acetate kinase